MTEMKCRRGNLFLSLVLLLTALPMNGRTVADSLALVFRQSKTALDTAYRDNGEAIRDMRQRLERAAATPGLQLKGIKVVGAASPEGSVAFNEWLSRQRADRIFSFVDTFYPLPDSLASFSFLGRDWQGLRKLVDADAQVPDRNETLSLLDEIIKTYHTGETENHGNLAKLKELAGGKPYKYLYANLFPSLRESKILLMYEQDSLQPFSSNFRQNLETAMTIQHPVLMLPVLVPIPIEEQPCRPFYMGIKTNLIYDAAAIPSLGVEFYLGKNFSLTANWNYAWWSHNTRHRFWRVYGGDIAGRWWFGNKALEKPLAGHHIGVYAQVFTYDFEFGGSGRMGGMPHKDIFHQPHIGGGVEYGYSLPIARRLNLDFSIGAGYFGGKVRHYEPSSTGYIWLKTTRRNWVGPTKAEVSLVWLLGCDNYNRRKGVAE